MTWTRKPTASELGLTSHQVDEWTTGKYKHVDVKFANHELESVDLAAAMDGLTREEFTHNTAVENAGRILLELEGVPE